ncbi:MAG: nitroreductase family protein [Chloroflexota bacterium]
MEFADVVRKRRMIRDFDSLPIPPEQVEAILAAAQRGPSSGFTQGFEFLVFEGAEQTARFWDALPWTNPDDTAGARRAPLIIVPLAHESAFVARYQTADKAAIGRKTGADFPAPYWFIDTAFAAMLILLSAVNADLGGFYFSIGPTSREIPRFREALRIPDVYYPIGAIAIGYPGESERIPPGSPKDRRRAPDTIIHRGSW